MLLYLPYYCTCVIDMSNTYAAYLFKYCFHCNSYFSLPVFYTFYTIISCFKFLPLKYLGSISLSFF